MRLAREKRGLALSLTMLLAGCSLVTQTDDLTGGGLGPGSDAGSSSDASSDAARDATARDGAVTSGDAAAPDTSVPLGDAAVLDAQTGGDASDGSLGSLYRALVLTDSPLGYWRLGESAGSLLAHDEASAHRDGAYVGPILFATPGALVSDPDTAVGFDGNSATVQLTADYDFPGNAPFSIEAWIKPSLKDPGYRHVFTRETTDGNGRQGYALFVQGTVGLAFERFVNDANDIVSTSFPSTTAYTYVVATYDGALMKLYVNGTLLASASDNRSAPAENQRAYIGSLVAGDSVFNGSIDEPAIYAGALQPARILAHYHTGIRQ